MARGDRPSRLAFSFTRTALPTLSRRPIRSSATSRRGRRPFGTGDAGHLRTNVASLLKPPLPEADRRKLAALFGNPTNGIGFDGHQGPAK